MKKEDITITFEIRATGDKPQAVSEDGRLIRGTAIVFEQESRVLADWDGCFVEVISKGAITQDLLDRSDVKCVFNHNREKLLGRSEYGKGTLRLILTDEGLDYEVELPRTSDGDTVLELIRRGDIHGCSFAFTANEPGAVEYWRDKEGMQHRRVNRIDGLYDVSPVIDPAYTQTKVEARSWEPAEEPAERSKNGERTAENDAYLVRVRCSLNSAR